MDGYKSSIKMTRIDQSRRDIKMLKVQSSRKQTSNKMSREDLMAWAEKFVEANGKDFDELVNR